MKHGFVTPSADSQTIIIPDTVDEFIILWSTQDAFANYDIGFFAWVKGSTIGGEIDVLPNTYNSMRVSSSSMYPGYSSKVKKTGDSSFASFEQHGLFRAGVTYEYYCM